MQFAYKIEHLPIHSTEPYAPFWDVENQNLFVSDYLDAKIFRFDWAEQRLYNATIKGGIKTTFIVPVKDSDDDYIISDHLSIGKVKWNGVDGTTEEVQKIFSVEKYQDSFSYWNIAKASPNRCQFFGGGIRGDICADSSTANVSLYYYSKRQGAQPLENLKFSGGVAFNTKDNKFYSIQSCANIILEYDWDQTTDKICERSE